MTTQKPDSAAVEALDKRLRWRSVSIVVFALFMVLLAVVAGWALLSPPRFVSGLPPDDAARAAQALLGPPPIVGSGHLRLTSEFAGESAPGFALSSAQAHAAADAESLLAGVVARHPLDPRGHAALGHLDLARRLLDRAAARYRRAIDLAPHYGEARLGLAVALALKADATPDPLRQRGLRLEALAQCIAVDPADAAHAAALYDRAWLAADVGRAKEADAAAARYWALDATSPWAVRLHERIVGKVR